MSKCTFTIYGALSCRRASDEKHATTSDDGEEYIKPFSDVSQSDKDHICRKLYQEWKSEYNKHEVQDGSGLCLKLSDNKTNEFFVAFDGDTWVGVVGLDPSGNYGLPIVVPCVNHMYIRKKYRSKGHGRRLLNYMDDIAVQRGYHMIALWCEPQMRSFYRKFGWSQLSGSLVSETVKEQKEHTPDNEGFSSRITRFNTIPKTLKTSSSFSPYNSAMTLLPATSFRSIYIMAKTYHG